MTAYIPILSYSKLTNKDSVLKTDLYLVISGFFDIVVEHRFASSTASSGADLGVCTW